MIREGDWRGERIVANIHRVTVQKFARRVGVIGAILVACASACSSAEVGVVPTWLGGLGDGGTPRQRGDTMCLLNHCDVDDDCANCTGGRHTCLVSERRCIACEPGSNNTCKNGQYCTKYGDCVPNGASCAEDAQGNPTGTCNSDADCVPCNPKHRVCSLGNKKCVGCSTTNTTNCQSTDICIAGTCVEKCPVKCNSDADCAQCGTVGNEAHACVNHRCGQCSATQKCANGATCDVAHGKCEAVCGLPGKPQQCTSAGNPSPDCASCKGGSVECNLPVNGGTGTCVNPANGCSEVGKGVLVLPPPFYRATSSCSNEGDCANVSANINVGKVLRDLTGISSIHDGDFPYPMHACAQVAQVKTPQLSCGLCVPCKTDVDCTPVDVDQLAGQLFGSVGSIGSKLLLDQVFGPNDHKLHMYCEQVASGYGACVPCPDLLHSCGAGSPLSPGPCDLASDLCHEHGSAIGALCNKCASDICRIDPNCCDVTGGRWDLFCVSAVDLYCTDKTCIIDTCAGKADGVYCSIDGLQGYECKNNAPFRGAGYCPVGLTCQRINPIDVKSPAITVYNPVTKQLDVVCR